MSQDGPQLWVFAGPNGAGKSTLIHRCNVAERIPVVNADDIADAIRKGGDQRSELEIVTQAGRQAVERRNALLREGRSFAIETTLTGHSELHLMQEAKARGYKVNLVFVMVASPELSNSRVTLRVGAGGHDVPEHDVLRRFPRSVKNLQTATAMSDRVCILDNSGRRYRFVIDPQEAQVLDWIEQTAQFP